VKLQLLPLARLSHLLTSVISSSFAQGTFLALLPKFVSIESTHISVCCLLYPVLLNSSFSTVIRTVDSGIGIHAGYDINSRTIEVDGINTWNVDKFTWWKPARSWRGTRNVQAAGRKD
jgi:hypothetical protein